MLLSRTYPDRAPRIHVHIDGINEGSQAIALAGFCGRALTTRTWQRHCAAARTSGSDFAIFCISSSEMMDSDMSWPSICTVRFENISWYSASISLVSWSRRFLFDWIASAASASSDLSRSSMTLSALDSAGVTEDETCAETLRDDDTGRTGVRLHCAECPPRRHCACKTSLLQRNCCYAECVASNCPCAVLSYPQSAAALPDTVQLLTSLHDNHNTPDRWRTPNMIFQ